MKKSKHNYITKFFENNLKNLKNTWKHIKGIIFMKSLPSYSPSLLTYESETIDNPKRMSNIFNNYFSTIGAKIPEKRKIYIKIILITSQMKIVILFSFHQPTKKKLDLLSPPLISTNLMDHIVFQIRF